VEGLKDRPRNDRSPDVLEEKLSKIRRELSETHQVGRLKKL
jgi:hypothetical protein